MHSIRNFFILVGLTIPFLSRYRAYSQLKKGRGVLHDFWANLLREIPEITNLDGPLQRRIHHYLFANSLTTQWFATLYGHTSTPNEKETGYYLATATPIADYLVDREKSSVEEIQKMMAGTSTHRWQKLTETLFQKSIGQHPNPNLCSELISKTLLAQEESLKQKTGQLSTQKLKQITWDKGGYALLLYRSAINVPITPLEWSAIYQLGGLMQLHNDIFDLYRDLQEEIATIPSTCKAVDQLRAIFSTELETTYRLFNDLPVEQVRKRKFFLLLSLAVNTGFICLDQYKQLENEDGLFSPASYTRKELVCDMDQLSKISANLYSTIKKKYL